MKKYKKIQVDDEVMYAIKCDRCKKEFSFKNDILEIQEFHCIDFIGGYSSVFGDGAEVNCDLCQYCLKELIKDFITEDNVSYE